MWEKNENLPQKLKNAQNIKNPVEKNKLYIQLLTRMIEELGGSPTGEGFSFSQILFSISNIWGESTDIFSDDLDKIETKDDFISLLNRMLSTLKENENAENLSSKAINKLSSIYQQQIEAMEEKQQLSQKLKTSAGKYYLLVSMIETFIDEYDQNYKVNLIAINDRPEVKRLDNDFTSLELRKNRITSETIVNPQSQSLQDLNHQLETINEAINKLEEIKEKLSLRLEAINKIIDTNRATTTPTIEIITKTTKVLNNLRSQKELAKEQELKVEEARAKSQQASEELNKYILTLNIVEETILSYPNLENNSEIKADSRVRTFYEDGQKLIAGKILNKGFPENPQEIKDLEEFKTALVANLKNLQDAITTAEEKNRQDAGQLALKEINDKIDALVSFNEKIAKNPIYSSIINLKEFNEKLETIKTGASQFKDYSLKNIDSAQKEANLLLNNLSPNEALKEVNNSIYSVVTQMRINLDDLKVKKSDLLKNVAQFGLGNLETRLEALEKLSSKMEDSYELFNLDLNEIKELNSAIQIEIKKAKSYELIIKERASSPEIDYLQKLLDEMDKAKVLRTNEIKANEIPDDPIIKILNTLSSLLIGKRDSYLNVEDISTSQLVFIDDFISTMNTVLKEKVLQKLTDTTSNIFVDFINVMDSIIESIKSFIAENLDTKNYKKSSYKPQFWPSALEQKMVSDVAKTLDSLQDLQENLQETVNNQKVVFK
ncbi:MAG: hypothetical protein H0T84_10640 [Tatlockia sp.]|nr:hypothetical protein [Tatlockia sp.]